MWGTGGYHGWGTGGKKTLFQEGTIALSAIWSLNTVQVTWSMFPYLRNWAPSLGSSMLEEDPRVSFFCPDPESQNWIQVRTRKFSDFKQKQGRRSQERCLFLCDWSPWELYSCFVKIVRFTDLNLSAESNQKSISLLYSNAFGDSSVWFIDEEW